MTYRRTMQGPVTKEALGRFANQRSITMAEPVTIFSAIANLKAALRELDELDESAAAAYVQHAVALLEDAISQ